ncbi:pentatricopeptide repeat-containing protein At2g37320-like [Panicum virgatum]|uniref:pentatricopeptide repeat-containing protein At2g37320-like n=1 Tax=Panicum virgatum TaxID=38727 RepID=UPI0019D61EA0|nr:pentatricopeptide repeat-containing protein At2g37320-like [Panicum virgatum]
MTPVNGPKSAAALYSSLLQSCIGSNAFRQGKSVHHRTVIAPSASPPDLHLSTKLVIFYYHFGDVAAARSVFDGMPHRSVVSWTAMVSAYAKNGRPREALKLFALMLRSGTRPNQFTFGSAASACAGARCPVPAERGAGARVRGQREVRGGHVCAERAHGCAPAVRVGGGCESAVCGDGEEGRGVLECPHQGVCGAQSLQ